MARVCLGQIGAAHGVRGEVRLHSFTADPAAIARYGPLETENGRVIEIESLRPAKDHFVARLSGVRDRNAAAQLAKAKLYVPRERLPEPAQDDEFYHADLIGLAVVDHSGRTLGSVVAIHNFGAGDLIEVKYEDRGKTEFVAFNDINVPTVDLAAGRLVVVPSPIAGEGDGATPRRAQDSPRRDSRRRPSAGPRKERR